MTSHDLIIIGSGAAGFSAATKARHLGVPRVAIVERGKIWGTCVNVGCIPSKFLLTIADIVYYKNHGHPGIRSDFTLDLPRILAEKEAIINRSLQKKVSSLVTGLGVEVVQGEAVFINPHEISINDQILSAPRFIIATGSSPSTPPVEGLDTIHPMTSDDALSPGTLPESLIVVGGRALGLEFAQLYTHLGVHVTVLQRSSRIIPEEEPEIADILSGYLIDEGVDIRTGVEIRKVRKEGTGIALTSVIKGHPEDFFSDRILFATGRTPNTKDLDLRRAGVNTGKNGEILVDETLQTSAPHIWAAGDVLGEPQLEVSAKFGGLIAAENAVTGKRKVFDRSALPHAIFTTPQVASVGLTEDQARKAGKHPVCRCTRIDALAKSAILGDTRGLVKIVAEEKSLRILGVHACAPIASEIIQEGVVAVKHQLTAQDLMDTFHVFPTVTEALWVCAREFQKDTGSDCPEPQET